MTLFGNIRKGLSEYSADPGAVLVDVREADEYAVGHIPGALSMPLSGITGCDLPKDVPIYLYCLRGTRSMRAACILKRMGYTKVRSIGGIKEYPGELER